MTAHRLPYHRLTCIACGRTGTRPGPPGRLEMCQACEEARVVPVGQPSDEPARVICTACGWSDITGVRVLFRAQSDRSRMVLAALFGVACPNCGPLEAIVHPHPPAKYEPSGDPFHGHAGPSGRARRRRRHRTMHVIRARPHAGA